MILHVDETNEYLVIDSCSQTEYDQLKLSYVKKSKNYRFSPSYKSGAWSGDIVFIKGKYLPATSYRYLLNV